MNRYVLECYAPLLESTVEDRTDQVRIWRLVQGKSYAQVAQAARAAWPDAGSVRWHAGDDDLAGQALCEICLKLLGSLWKP